MEDLIVGLVFIAVFAVVHLPFVVLDLRRQQVQVGRSWSLPAVVFSTLFGLLFVVGYLLADHGLDAAKSTLQAVQAINLVVWVSATSAALGITFARSIRPGGAARWRWGAASTAVLVVLALFLPSVFLGNEPSPGDLIIALPMALFALLAVGRTGTDRLEEGSRTAVSAALLGTFCLAVGMLATTWIDATADLTWLPAFAIWGLLTAWASLLFSLRRWLWIGVLVDLVALGATVSYTTTARAFPWEVGAPEPVDWWEDPTDQFAASEVPCFEVAGSGTRFGNCKNGEPALVMSDQATTSALLLEREKNPELRGLALGRGEALLRWAENPPERPDITAVDGRPHYRGRPISREILRAHPPEQPLWFEASPDLNLLQLTRYCATATTGNRCGVMRGG